MATSKDIEKIKSSLADLRSGMCWIFRMVGTSVNSRKNVAADAKYISNQPKFHASRIDDNTRYMHELMGKVSLSRRMFRSLLA